MCMLHMCLFVPTWPSCVCVFACACVCVYMCFCATHTHCVCVCVCPTPPNDQDQIGADSALAISSVASLVGIWPMCICVQGYMAQVLFSLSVFTFSRIWRGLHVFVRCLNDLLYT